MSGWLLPALVLAAAPTSTYVCCVRPMRSGGCHRTPVGTLTPGGDLERQLREARAERDRLRVR